MQESFTKGQIVEATGLSARMVSYYTDLGLVVPPDRTKRGRGNVRRYSVKNLFQFSVIRELWIYGARLKFIEDVFSYLDNQGLFDNLEKLKDNLLILQMTFEQDEMIIQWFDERRKELSASSILLLNLTAIYQRIKI